MIRNWLLLPSDSQRKGGRRICNMESSLQSVLVEALSEKELKEILNDLYMDDTVDLLEELPANLVTRIPRCQRPEGTGNHQQTVKLSGRQRRKYHTTTEYVDTEPYLTVGQALAHIKKTGIHKETIYTCYVTDKRKLIGIVSAKDLMTTDDGILISD